MEDGVSIGKQSWIYAIVSDHGGSSYEPEMLLGQDSKIGAYCHLTCARKVRLGKNVLLGQGVYVSDNIHGYEDVSIPIRLQRLSVKATSIGDDTWLGNNSAVISCSIGRHCVVGANAVVTKDVPDFCVVVGAPARIVKKYDPETGTWRRVDYPISSKKIQL